VLNAGPNKENENHFRKGFTCLCYSLSRDLFPAVSMDRVSDDRGGVFVSELDGLSVPDEGDSSAFSTSLPASASIPISLPNSISRRTTSNGSHPMPTSYDLATSENGVSWLTREPQSLPRDSPFSHVHEPNDEGNDPVQPFSFTPFGRMDNPGFIATHVASSTDSRFHEGGRSVPSGDFGDFLSSHALFEGQLQDDQETLPAMVDLAPSWTPGGSSEDSVFDLPLFPSMEASRKRKTAGVEKIEETREKDGKDGKECVPSGFGSHDQIPFVGSVSPPLDEGDIEKAESISFPFPSPSSSLRCGLCGELPTRFGLLINCCDIFCLACIRQHRQGQSMEESRLCPLCHTPSFFVIPSSVFPETEEEKDVIVEGYKKKLGTIPCKYFDEGRRTCPFGSSCFYSHIIQGKGHSVEEGGSASRIYIGNDGIQQHQDVRLSDFIMASLEEKGSARKKTRRKRKKGRSTKDDVGWFPDEK
jgi:hypothetical protein